MHACSGHIWPAAAPEHCHVVEVKGMSLEESALSEIATSSPFMTAPPTLLVKERWKLGQLWSTGQTVAGSILLYSLTREALFTKARSACFHSLCKCSILQASACRQLWSNIPEENSSWETPPSQPALEEDGLCQIFTTGRTGTFTAQRTVQL